MGLEAASYLALSLMALGIGYVPPEHRDPSLLKEIGRGLYR